MTPKSNKDIEVIEEEDYTGTRNSANKEHEPTKREEQLEIKDEAPAIAQPQTKARHTEDDNKSADGKRVADGKSGAFALGSKAADKLPCPDCGRLLSKKTLTYSHKYHCKSKQKL